MSSNTQNIGTLEKQIRYFFRHKALLLEALMHKSHYHEIKNKDLPCNERLEFLGDSVIGLIIVEKLFLIKEQHDESALAKMKSYLVSEPVLAELADSIALGKYLFLGKGEESTGGRKKQSVLSNALEAVVGAVYLDGGYEQAKNMVLNLYEQKVSDAIESGQFHDYKTELQEKSQLLYSMLPEYRVVSQEGEEHKRVFTVAVFLDGKKMGVASGKRKKEAESLAARKALEALKESSE